MSNRRMDRDDYSSHDRDGEAVVVAAATLRPPEPRHDLSKPHDPAHAEDRMLIFWRVFGGTILSIIALMAVTLYNNVTSNINDLRTELNRANEARSELVKKEEFNTRTQSMWNRVQDLQDLRLMLTTLKEQVATLSEKRGDLKSVQEKLTAIDQRVKAAEDDHRTVAQSQIALSMLEQKLASREAQIKTLEDDRKELAKQLQEIRERVAKVEGITEVKPMPKTGAAKN